MPVNRSLQGEESVKLNWVFFNPEHPRNKSVRTEIPVRNFESSSGSCSSLFVKELREWHGFIAKKTDIDFYQVRGTTPNPIVD